MSDKAQVQSAKDMLEMLKEQDKLIKQLMMPAPIYVPVLGVINMGKEGMKLLSVVGDHVIEISLPEGEDVKITPGQMIKVTPDTHAFIEVVKNYNLELGHVYVVRRQVSKHTIEVEASEEAKMMYYFLENPTKPGDRVIADSSGSLVVKNLGPEIHQHTMAEETHISWDEVGGHEQAKEDLIDAVISPIKHKEIYEKYGKKRAKGALLYGAPGNGKTLLARALASEIAKASGSKVSKGFFYVKGPEILSKWVGESERMIREIFARCREHFSKHGYAATLFIDECDALLSKRGSGRSSDVERTIVPMFLAEMDGLDDSGAFVLLATNRADTLDPAILRDGRVDRKIEVKSPDQKMAEQIFKIHLREKPLESKVDLREFAKESASMLYSEELTLCGIERRSGGMAKFTVASIVSGAMIAGLAEEATSQAIRRDIKEGKTKGVTMDNMKSAISKLYREQYSMDHKDAIDRFTEPWRADVKSVVKIPIKS